MSDFGPWTQLSLFLPSLCSTRRGIFSNFIFFTLIVSLIFHIFWTYNSYQEVKKYKLGDPKSFHYLNQSKCYELIGVNDSEEYLATRRAMSIVGISETEQVLYFYRIITAMSLYSVIMQSPSHAFQEAIFKVVAAILHLGNIEFAKGKEVDSSILKDEKSKFHLRTTVDLLEYE